MASMANLIVIDANFWYQSGRPDAGYLTMIITVKSLI